MLKKIPVFKDQSLKEWVGLLEIKEEHIKLFEDAIKGLVKEGKHLPNLKIEYSFHTENGFQDISLKLEEARHIAKGKRICRKCNKLIGKYHKWVVTPIGLEHRNCNDPESYK